MDIVFSFLGLYLLIKITDHWLSARGYRGETSDHFDGRVFRSYGDERGEDDPANENNPAKKDNPVTQKRMSFAAWLWLLNRPKSDWRWKENAVQAKPRERVSGGELVITFINHATVLIQTEGLNILTDPVWSKRVSPFRLLGPKRYRAPGIDFVDLPPIDIVLLSHNHYDHMDIATLKQIQEKWSPQVFVGLGNTAYLARHDIVNVRDMDWWDREEAGRGVAIVCAPGQHFSSRALSDRNNTLWSGFVIETKHGDIYFAGDTGYGPFVEHIKVRYPEFRLALLPIGAFKPEWFMGAVHTSPDQALAMHRELNIHTSIGIHFGTFHLADDAQEEPPARIKELLAAHTDPKPDFRILENGESVSV